MIWAVIALYILGAATNALWTHDNNGMPLRRYVTADWLWLIGEAVLWPLDLFRYIIMELL